MLREYLPLIVSVLYIIAIILVAVRILLDAQNSTKAVAYLMLIVFLPVLGVIIYFTFGVNYRKKKLYKDKLVENKALREKLSKWIIKETSSNKESFKELIGDKDDLINLLMRDSFSPLSDNNKVELLINGEEKFPKVLEALEKAKDHIHIEYYIYEDDKIGNEIKDILIRKAKEGVNVRFIYDDFGAHAIKKHIARELRDGGVKIYPFYEIKFFFLANRYNYRNHRKIIIVDGKVAFLGGINVSDRYINKKRSKHYWRDTHMRIEGEAVYMLQFLFLSDWNFCCEKNFQLSPVYFPEVTVKKNQLVQIVSSGPDSDRPSIMLSFFTAIVSARKQLYITTPYFIPNDSVLDAIKKAALSGVDVRILVPEKSDVPFVNFASRAYYGDLLSTGARIFFYKKGFIHAKAIAVDDNLSLIGTANVDIRSFDLNFEVISIVYDKKLNRDLKTVFLNDLEDSEEIFFDKWNSRGKWIQLAESAVKLVGPIL